MKTSLAWRNLAHQKTRTLIAVAGVAFAIILIFMQYGFHGSLQVTATRIYGKLEFDVLLISSDYQSFARAGSFPRQRLLQAASAPGVMATAPLYIGVNAWRNPDPPSPLDAAGRPGGWGQRLRRIQILGFDLNDPIFRDLAEIDEARDALRTRGHVLMDRRSRREFGLRDARSNPEQPFVPTDTDLGLRQVQVAGFFTLGTGFGADGLLVASDETFAHVFGRPLDSVSLGLLRVSPGADPTFVADDLNHLLPKDVRARSRARVLEMEAEYWFRRTAVGMIFRMGLFVVLVVGVVFVYQVMSSDVAARLPEYATLKAIGYEDRRLAGVVLRQALLLGLFAYVPAYAAALALDYLTRASAGIPIEMTPARAMLVLALSLGMCSLSGLLALRKLRSADPADLF